MREWKYAEQVIDEVVKEFSSDLPKELVSAIAVRLRKERLLVDREIQDERAAEFNAGYDAGYNGMGYRPSSFSWAEGYESGVLAAYRLGKGRANGDGD